jgi:hypothetical protein
MEIRSVKEIYNFLWAPMVGVPTVAKVDKYLSITALLGGQQLCWSSVLGNSGKPVTLETSSLTKFLRYVFRVANMRFSGILNLRSL